MLGWRNVWTGQHLPFTKVYNKCINGFLPWVSLFFYGAGASCMLGKHFVTELHPQPFSLIIQGTSKGIFIIRNHLHPHHYLGVPFCCKKNICIIMHTISIAKEFPNITQQLMSWKPTHKWKPRHGQSMFLVTENCTKLLLFLI